MSDSEQQDTTTQAPETIESESQDKPKSPTADNALKSGAWRYLATGELPKDLEGADTELAAQLLKFVGNDERFRPMALLAARRYVFIQLYYNYIKQQCKEKPGIPPTAIEKLGSMFEGARRDLAEMCLTPASASKLKETGLPDYEKIIEQTKDKDDSTQH